jgi:hypothetical protein
VAAGEDEGQTLVRDRVHVLLLRRHRLEPRQRLGLLPEDAVTADAVDRPVPRSRDDPGAGIPRLTFPRPSLDGGGEGVLYRILGELEVAEGADQDCDRTAPLLAEDGCNVR